MSRPTPISTGPAADARASLAEPDTAAFDRLAHALLSSPSAPLGPLLRAQLPGTAGVRWLVREALAPTTRPTELTGSQWLSLFETWRHTERAPAPRGGSGRGGGRPSTHGVVSANPIPRWGS